MYPQYLSPWLFRFFLIWLLAYVFKITIITNNFNPYYVSVILLIGYIISEFYYVFIKQYTYEPSFFLVKCFIHIIPFVLSYHLIKDKHTNSLRTFLLLFIPYMIYLSSLQTNMWEVYFVKKPPTYWGEIV